MKLILENWREYIKEIEVFDDFADTPEKIEKNLQYYYRVHAPNKGKRKDLGEWKEGNQLVVFLLSEDNKFFFVVNENDEPLAYIAVAPFRESYSVGNMSKKPGEKSFYQTEFYEKVMEVLGKGSLYSDSRQTTGGRGLWERFPNKKRVETEKEDGDGRWRYRIGKEVNEIFGFGKKKKKKARVTLNQLQNIYANYREYMKHYYRTSGKLTIKDLVRDSAKKRRIREIEELIPHIQSDIIVIKNLIEDMASGEYYWPEELQGIRPPNFNDWNLLSDPEKFLDKLLWRMNAAEKNLKNLHKRYAKGLGFDRYTGDVEADYEAIKDFMATAKER